MNSSVPSAGPSAHPSEPGTVRLALADALELLSSPELRKNLQLLTAILDNITDGVAVANLQGELVLFNRAAEEILGLQCTHAAVADWSSRYGCFLPDAITLYPSAELPLARAIRGQEIRDAEIFIRNPQRPRGVWVRANAAPLRDEQGHLCGGVVAFRDSTARKRAEQRLAALYAVSRALAQSDSFDHAARCICDLLCQTLHWQFGAVFTPDASGVHLRCLYCFHSPLSGLQEFATVTRQLVCEQGLGILGLAAAGSQPLLISSLPDEPGCLRADPARHAGLQGGLLFPVRHAGQLVAVFEFYHLFPGSGSADLLGLASNFQNLMVQFLRQRRAEHELRDLTAELVRSNNDLEQFACVASHDLQEPLRMVASYCRLLQQRYQELLDDSGREFLGFALEGAERMQNMIQGLLTFARVSTQPQTLVPVNTLVVLERAMHHLGVRFQETRGRVSVDQLPIITADSAQLLQLFQNLLANALKFHGDRPPRIHVSASWIPSLAEARFRTAASKHNSQSTAVVPQAPASGDRQPEAKGSGWLFSVRDEGIGIPEAAQERLFRLFERLHPPDQYPGVGMGLAICRKIVARHGGCIWVASQPGQGTTFFFTWPSGVRSQGSGVRSQESGIRRQEAGVSWSSRPEAS